MANYVNLFNNTNKVLNIEIVPKNQASAVTFKGEPPINYRRDEDGVYRFTLATTMLDRVGLVMAFPIKYVFEKIDGVTLETPIVWTGALSNGLPSIDPLTTDYDLAQLGIGVMRSQSNMFYEGDLGTNINSIYLYNLNSNKNVVLEGYIEIGDVPSGPPGNVIIESPQVYRLESESESVPKPKPTMELPILRQRSTSIFDDPDLIGDSMIIDQNNNVGIALGGLHKPAGTGLTWSMGIYDQESLEGTLYIATTVVHDDGDSVPLKYTKTLSRESTETFWSDAINYDELNEDIITSLNQQYAEATEFEYPLFADARTESSGALFLISFTKDIDKTANPFLPETLTDSIDGSWGDGGPIFIEPMGVVVNTPIMSVSEEPMGSIGDGGIAIPMPMPMPSLNPLGGLDWISVRVQGTPLIDMAAFTRSMNNKSPDTDLEMSEEMLTGALAWLYKLKNVRLVVHTDNPEEGKPLMHFGHNTEDSSLRKWGEDVNDFTILSAGVMLRSIRDLFDKRSPIKDGNVEAYAV